MHANMQLCLFALLLSLLFYVVVLAGSAIYCIIVIKFQQKKSCMRFALVFTLYSRIKVVVSFLLCSRRYSILILWIKVDYAHCILWFRLCIIYIHLT